MKVYYNQRFVYDKVQFSMCPHARVELNQKYTKSQIDELVLKEIKQFSIDNDIEEHEAFFYLEYYITVE